MMSFAPADEVVHLPSSGIVLSGSETLMLASPHSQSKWRRKIVFPCVEPVILPDESVWLATTFGGALWPKWRKLRLIR